MTKSLFTDFESVSAKEWKQKIQYDLKGVDYNEALIYKTLEGIDIKPFYNSEDVENLDIYNQNPTSWNNCLKIEVDNAEEGNAKAIDGIKKGAESIYFIVKVWIYEAKLNNSYALSRLNEFHGLHEKIM